MPDLVTHVSAGIIISRLLRKKLIMPLFLLGSILPDVSFKILELFFPSFHFGFMAFHSLPSQTAISLVLSQYFEKGEKRSAFLNLFAGATTHLLFDFAQLHITGENYYWFLPFSSWHGELGLFSTTSWIYYMPVMFTAALAAESIFRLSGRWRRR